MSNDPKLFYLKTIDGCVFEAYLDDGACYGYDRHGNNIDDLPQYVFKLRDAMLKERGWKDERI